MQDSVLASVDCSQGSSQCNASTVWLYGIQNEQVVLRVTEATVVSVDTVAPKYESPNQCAHCLNGNATMRLR